MLSGLLDCFATKSYGPGRIAFLFFATVFAPATSTRNEVSSVKVVQIKSVTRRAQILSACNNWSGWRQKRQLKVWGIKDPVGEGWRTLAVSLETLSESATKMPQWLVFETISTDVTVV